jgi:hypothetical protein
MTIQSPQLAFDLDHPVELRYGDARAYHQLLGASLVVDQRVKTPGVVRQDELSVALIHPKDAQAA